MRFLIISDGHGNVDMLDKLDEEFKSCDAVLFGGDFAKFNETETGLPFLQRLCKKHEKIYAVLGNCDEPEFIEQLENADISVVNSVLYSDGLAFIGSSHISSSSCPYAEMSSSPLTSSPSFVLPISVICSVVTGRTRPRIESR